MERNLPVYKVLSPDNVCELEEAHKQGYEFVAMFQEPKVDIHTVKSIKPIQYQVTYSTSNGTMPQIGNIGQNYNYNSYNNQAPPTSYEEIKSEVVVVLNEPKILMKLNKAGSVLYGQT